MRLPGHVVMVLAASSAVSQRRLSTSERCVAGRRYRKRGVNDAGRVANEVEIEQVVDAGFDWRTGFPLLASLVQVRAHARMRPFPRSCSWPAPTLS